MLLLLALYTPASRSKDKPKTVLKCISTGARSTVVFVRYLVEGSIMQVDATYAPSIMGYL